MSARKSMFLMVRSALRASRTMKAHPSRRRLAPAPQDEGRISPADRRRCWDPRRRVGISCDRAVSATLARRASSISSSTLHGCPVSPADHGQPTQGARECDKRRHRSILVHSSRPGSHCRASRPGLQLHCPGTKSRGAIRPQNPNFAQIALLSSAEISSSGKLETPSSRPPRVPADRGREGPTTSRLRARSPASALSRLAGAQRRTQIADRIGQPERDGSLSGPIFAGKENIVSALQPCAAALLDQGNEDGMDFVLKRFHPSDVIGVFRQERIEHRLVRAAV